jgi:hypothetical protein
MARVVTIGISDSTSSSTHVASYSGKQPMKGKVGLVIFTVKPLLVPTLEGILQGEIKEITM